MTRHAASTGARRAKAAEAAGVRKRMRPAALSRGGAAHHGRSVPGGAPALQPSASSSRNSASGNSDHFSSAFSSRSGALSSSSKLTVCPSGKGMSSSGSASAVHASSTKSSKPTFQRCRWQKTLSEAWHCDMADRGGARRAGAASVS
eukprot:CAMPEP_0170426078 /NCGR_PEP_ID=MMETSP0117_2-20130122/38458_1 /TAXON_ID=400756 /ORGANISM="Durinskia baltica, Strain CSIRO CS-38" /LENGTH=146 /DNA_ID=CAMNT_0010685107 /DNA_START=3 /DNA_END=439 /DNA_ORIENTATION=+